MSTEHHIPYLSYALNQAGSISCDSPGGQVEHLDQIHEMLMYGDTIERLHTRLHLMMEKPWADELIVALDNLSRANDQAYGDLLTQAVGAVVKATMLDQKPLFKRKTYPWTYQFAA